MPSARQIASQLTETQRELLVRHVDGRADVVATENLTRNRLIGLALIMYPPSARAPRYTRITAFGREVLIMVLAAQADALTTRLAYSGTPVIALNPGQRDVND